MKKLLVDKRYFKICIHLFFLAVAVIAVEKLLGNINSVTDTVGGFFSFVFKLLTPFIYGFFIAYLANPAVRVFDRLFGYIPGFTNLRIRRACSVLLTFVIVILLLVLVVSVITPEIMTSFKILSDNVRDYIALLQNQGNINITNESISLFFNDIMADLDSFLNTINSIFSTSFSSSSIISVIIDGVNAVLTSLPGIAAQIFAGTMSFAGSLINLLLGFFIAFYMLMEKEHYSKEALAVIYAAMKKQTADKFSVSVRRANRIFEKFIVGKSLDSLIVGVIFFIAALILRLPYAVLLSVIIGVTNMIPFIGPFIGAVPVILIVLITSLSSVSAAVPFTIYPTLITGIVILVLQQLDGNVIGPKILGDSTGLKPLEVIFAITVGGALFGILGMFLGVPVLGVLKMALQSFVSKRYSMRQAQESTGGGVDDGIS